MSSKTLVIMAAGLASRYGGGKQTAAFGPNGEMLMEYSINDAKNAGFDQVVIIVSENMSRQFRDDIKAYVSGIEIQFAVQSFKNLPGWFKLPEGRVKPYGTIHAVLSAKEYINGPFVVMNADDYYGKPAIETMAAMLDNLPEKGEGCMVTYPISNTMSVFGTVTRGICSISDDGYLLDICETKNITLAENGEIVNINSDGTQSRIPDDAMASMNIFGLTPEVLPAMETMFLDALRAPSKSPLTDEYLVPVFIDKLIKDGKLRIRTQPTESEWFGVTYPQDADAVKAKLKDRPSPRS